MGRDASVAGVPAWAEVMELELRRDNNTLHNWGKLFVDGKYLGETLEDVDRFLEDGGKKVQDDTAIPRGRYKVTLTPSVRFNNKLMPLVVGVTGFTGIRIHGGNTESDTHGCPLLGHIRTDSGIANCAGVNERLINLIAQAYNDGQETWLTVT